MRIRRFVSLLATVVLVVGLAAAVGSAAFRAASGPDMTTAAQKWIGSLSAEQKAKSVLDYGAPVRTDWHFIPKATRKGLQIREMNPDQRAAAHSLLKASLSEIGYGKVTKIMELENVLKELEKTRTNSPLRDAERYYFTVFGEPKETGRWGLSIEGHHMSFNFVVDGGKVISSTPSMFGTNPATLKGQDVAGVKAGTRILAQEEQLAFDLLASLNPEQRKAAVFAEKALDEVRTAGAALPPAEAPVGIVGSKLNDQQKKLLRELIGVYASAMPEEAAKARTAEVDTDGVDGIHFGWAGADKTGIGHYYRVQGKTFVIEFVNTQPDSAGNPANHIHCTWRDLRGDFALPIK